VSLNRARTEQPVFEVAASAVLIGQADLGAGALLAQGVVLRSRTGAVRLGNHSAVLENGVLVGWPGQPVEIGQRTVFGHRATIVGARVGDLCEIGNGAILMPGSRLGDGCILGEGTLIPAATVARLTSGIPEPCEPRPGRSRPVTNPSACGPVTLPLP